MVESDYIWLDSWIHEHCMITSSYDTYKEIQETLKHSPKGYRRQLERRLAHVGQLTKPISDKNYMYQIEAHYYECYIFGKNANIRLLFDWTKDVETSQVVIDVMGLADHNEVKKRKFKESDELDDQLTEEDLLFLERFL